MPPERRQHRSRNVFVALGLWLEAMARRSGSGFVLTDDRGGLIATSLPAGCARELASLAPQLARDDVEQSMTALVVWEIPALGGRLLLCSVGQGPANTLKETAGGVRRIMRELLGNAAWAPI